MKTSPSAKDRKLRLRCHVCNMPEKDDVVRLLGGQECRRQHLPVLQGV